MQAPPLPPTLDHPRIKVLTAGSSGCGKSCLIKRFCEGRFVSKYIPTIGIDYGVKKVDVAPQKIAEHRQRLTAAGKGAPGGAPGSSSAASASSAISAVRVNFWDVAGGEEGFPIRNEFYAPAQGILLVYDVRDADSFRALDGWLEEMREYTTDGADPSGSGVGGGGGGGPRRKSSQAMERRRVSGTAATTTANTPAGRAVGDLGGKAPIVYLLANKVDDVAVVPGEKTKRVVAEEEGRRWAGANGCAAYYETSAASDVNVTEAMESLFYDVMAKFM